MPVNKTLLSRAQSAVIARDFDLATRLYTEMLSEQPNDIDLLRQLGNLYVKSGKDDQALPVFKKITEIASGDVDALISIGGIFRRQKKYDESIAVLERALATGTNTTQVSYNLGFTFRQMGKYDDAIACFEDVVDQNPNDVLAFNHIGAIYAERGEHEDAINTYLRGLKIDPNHPILQMNLAKSYEATGANNKAVAAYASALKAKPGWLECIDNYSKLLLSLNRVRDAYDLINGALRLNAEDAKMHTRMGDVYFKQSIFPDAEKEYKEALTYDEEYIPALEGLVDSQENQGKSEEAVKTIQKIEKIAPDNPVVMQKSAGVYLSANYLPAAYEKIMQLMDSSSKDVQTLSLLGQYYISNGEWAQAEETLQKIIALDPSYSEFYRAGAKRFVQVGKTDEAEKYLQKAISQNPHDAEALTQLGALYEQNNQMEKAYDAYRKATVVDVNNNQAKTSLLRVRNQQPALAVYDVAPSLEMQNAEIQDGILRKGAPSISDALLQPAPHAKKKSPAAEIPSAEQDAPDPEAAHTPEPVPAAPDSATDDDVPELLAADDDAAAESFAGDGEGLHNLLEDEPLYDDLLSAEETDAPSVPAPNPQPVQETTAPVDDDGFDFDSFQAFDPFEHDGLDDETVGENEMPPEPELVEELPPEPEEEHAEAADDEEDFDVPDALSETLDKISAAADKATRAANKAMAAAQKAADIAQSLEDTAADLAERDLLPDAVEEVGTTEGDSEITDDDLDTLVDVPILELPEETTEVTDNDLDELVDVPILDLPEDEDETEVTDDDLGDIRVPILSPGDSVTIPGITAESDPDTQPKELSSPSILGMVEETDTVESFKPSLELFKTLRSMTADLPAHKLDVFRASKMSDTLDAIIAKLEG